MASWSSGYVIGNWIRVSRFESWKFQKSFFFFFWILFLKSSKNYNAHFQGAKLKFRSRAFYWGLFHYWQWFFQNFGVSMILVLSDAPCTLETVQDFLIKLDIKPLIHLLEMCPIFVCSVYNFGKSDNDIIYWKSTYFQ